MSNQIKVLVLEDSADDYELSINYLKNAEFDIYSEVFWDKQAFIQALSNGTWDIILCDYDMPQFSALDALKIVQEKKVDIPFIVISGSISEEIAVNTIKAGANDYLMKDKLIKLPFAVARELREAKSRKEKNKQEKELAQTYGELKGIMDAIDQTALLVIADENGNLKSVNKNFCKLTGYNQEELIGLSFKYFSQNTDDLDLFDNINEQLKKMQSWKTAFKIKTKTQKNVWLDASFSPILNKENNQHGYVLLAYDMTERRRETEERKKLIQELLKNNEDLEQFNYIISHNLRGPVAKLLGLTDVFQFDDTDEEVKQKIITELRNETEVLDTILRDLGSITAIKKSQADLVAVVNLSETFELANKLIKNEFEDIDFALSVDFNEAKEVFGIKSYLQSILYNLLSNSIKYRNPEQKLNIFIKSEHQKDNKILISFSDNGMGIDLEKYKNKIFGLYKRFHHHVQGKGMGLYIIKTQVERMGGGINVESNLGTGTTFKILLPSNNQKIS